MALSRRNTVGNHFAGTGMYNVEPELGGSGASGNGDINIDPDTGGDVTTKPPVAAAATSLFTMRNILIIVGVVLITMYLMKKI